MKRLALLLALAAGPASAQTYIATEVGQPCPPNSVLVTLQDGRKACASGTITPLETSKPEDKK